MGSVCTCKIIVAKLDNDLCSLRNLNGGAQSACQMLYFCIFRLFSCHQRYRFFYRNIPMPSTKSDTSDKTCVVSVARTRLNSKKAALPSTRALQAWIDVCMEGCMPVCVCR